MKKFTPMLLQNLITVTITVTVTEAFVLHHLMEDRGRIRVSPYAIARKQNQTEVFAAV